MELIELFYWDEWIALMFGLVYVFLAAANRPSCWIFGIISCGFWAYGTFTHYGLYFDMALNVFYVIIGFWGLYSWLYTGEGGNERSISELKWTKHTYLIGVGGLITIIIAYFFSLYTSANAPYIDAFTTIFSVLATFLLVYKIHSNWIYWIITDATYVFLYIMRGADLYAALFIINTILAVYGYYRWKKLI